MIKSRFPSSAFKGDEMSPLQPEYGYFSDKEKGICFGQIGQINVQDEINSHVGECDISILREQFLPSQVDTDFSCLSDFIADFSEMPANVFELQAMSDLIKQQYYQLPKEVRAKYGNSLQGLADAVISDRVDPIDLENPEDKSQQTGGQGEQQLADLARLVAEYQSNHNASGGQKPDGGPDAGPGSGASTANSAGGQNA